MTAQEVLKAISKGDKTAYRGLEGSMRPEEALMIAVALPVADRKEYMNWLDQRKASGIIR